MKAAIYLRVSTRTQRLDSQREATMRAAEKRGLAPVVFEDHASGAKFSRDGLDAMMARARKGEFAAVICFKLDRLGRSLPHLAQLVGELSGLGVGVVAVDQGIDTTKDNPAAKLQMHVLMAVAEFERSMIRERTMAGLDAARKRGRRPGRPPGSKSVPSGRKKTAERFMAETDWSDRRIAREVGASATTVWRWRKALFG